MEKWTNKYGDVMEIMAYTVTEPSIMWLEILSISPWLPDVGNMEAHPSEPLP